jgi:hypothetical protein
MTNVSVWCTTVEVLTLGQIYLSIALNTLLAETSDELVLSPLRARLETPGWKQSLIG